MIIDYSRYNQLVLGAVTHSRSNFTDRSTTRYMREVLQTM